MSGVFRKIGIGIAASLFVGAIAACQQSPDTAEDSTLTPESPTEEQVENTQPSEPVPTQPQTTEPSDTSAAPEGAIGQVKPEPAAPTAKPIPPLPAECTNPQTQTAMNTCAEAEYAQADTKLNNVYQSVKAPLAGEKANQLISAEEAWLDFRDAYCDFVQAQYAGGSIQPTVYYGCLTQLTSDRIATLQQTQPTSVSFEAADQELNAVYQNLQDYLGSAEQDQLTDAQLAWIDYRDAHCAFASGDTNACLASVTATRTQQLQRQVEARSM